MKIILVLHDKLDNPPASNGSESFEQQWERLKSVPIRDARRGDTTKAVYRFYTSTALCTKQTAEKLFGDQALVEEPLLDESLPAKQSEQTKADCKKLVDKLEEACEDCVLVSHENKIKALLSELKHRGYLVEKPRLFGIQPLDRIRASKKSLHCGGCQHNCILTDPKCDVGKDRAMMRGMQSKQ